MPSLKIIAAKAILQKDGTYTVYYLLEGEARSTLSGLTQDEAERRGERVGHYIQIAD